MDSLFKVVDPLPTLGGKSQLIADLVIVFNQCIEEHRITSICDLFMGGNRLFLHLDNDCIRLKIANEIDRGVVAFFRCLQNPYKIDQLIQTIGELADYIKQEDKFEVAKKLRLNSNTDQITTAALTYIVTKYSRATNRKDYCETNALNGINLASVEKKFIGLDGVIGDVQIMCGDYEEQFHKYKHREDFMFWIDPPYLSTQEKEDKQWGDKQPQRKTKVTNGYIHPFDLERQEQLIQNLISDDCKAKVVLCGYMNDLYKLLVTSGKFHCYFIGMVHVSSSSTGKIRPEFIWSNFEIPGDVLPIPN